MATKLDPRYSYHNINHSRALCFRVLELAKLLHCNAHTCELLYTAAVYHDIGHIAHHDGHEELGVCIFQEYAAQTAMKAEDVQIICQLIRATKLHHKPKNLLECLIKDADLYYLVTDEYQRQSILLKNEMQWLYGPIAEADWQKFQYKFLSQHRYETPGIAPQLNQRLRRNLHAIAV